MPIDADHLDVTLDPVSTKEIVITIIKTVGDPFLVTALTVVFLMFILLLKKEKSHREAMKEIFNELHAMALLITEQGTTLKMLVEWVMANAKRKNDK